MNTPLLIDSIVRQVTVLIAQLGTAGGLRAPMAHLANQVFLHLAEELEAQGVSRKVSADMFGMALRAYVRKVTHLREGHTTPGVTLWQAVLEFIREHGLVLRSRVLERFARDPETVLLSVLHDLSESGLAFVLGSGSRVAYRAASEDELGELARSGQDEGLEELVWALVLHDGPLNEAALAKARGQTCGRTRGDSVVPARRRSRAARGGRIAFGSRSRDPALGARGLGGGGVRSLSGGGADHRAAHRAKRRGSRGPHRG
jgi:hypothetical protein